MINGRQIDDWKRYFNNEKQTFKNKTKEFLMLENQDVIN